MGDDTDNKELKPVARRKPPSAGRGRKHGELNKTTRSLKEAILLAATEHGEDDTGKNGLTGYLRKVAREDVKAFAGLLGRVLPIDVNASGNFNVIITGNDSDL